MASSISFVVFLFSATVPVWSLKGQSCVKLDPELFAPCVNIGYTHTFPLPPYVDITKVSEMLYFFRDEVTANCSVPTSTTDTLHCTMLLPLCVEGRETPLLPCRRVCADALQGCTNAVKAHMLDEVGAMCNVLPDSTAASSTCFEPKGYNLSSNKVDVASLGKCHKLLLPYCRDQGYNHTYLSNNTQAKHFKEDFNKTLDTSVNQTEYYELKLINETQREYPECVSILKKLMCAEIVPPCYPGETTRFYGLCSAECQRLHDLCPEFIQSHPAEKEFCGLMAGGTAAHGFCGHTKWPEDDLHWAMKVKLLASRSKKINPGLIAAAVIVPVIMVILVIGVCAVIRWKKYSIFVRLQKADDIDPIVTD